MKNLFISFIFIFSASLPSSEEQIKDSIKNIRKRVFDISENGLLYHTFINDEYVLLPIGDNFEKIQEACKNIFK